MKVLFFDAGPIITLVMSRLVWILPLLKKKYAGKFYITPAVQRELVEHPLAVKRFEFEALQVMKLIRDGTLELYAPVPSQKVQELQVLANTSFRIRDQAIDILQTAEIESVASALRENADAVVMDERTLRLFIENKEEMGKLLEMRFRKEVKSDQKNMGAFVQQLKGITIIRSIELVGVAYKIGLLNEYVPSQKSGKETLLDAVLWAAKYNGCAVTEHEIEEIKRYLLKN